MAGVEWLVCFLEAKPYAFCPIAADPSSYVDRSEFDVVIAPAGVGINDCGIRRPSAICARWRAHKVGAAGDANHFAVTHHGQLPHTMNIERLRDLRQAGVVWDREDHARHDVIRFQPMRLYIAIIEPMAPAFLDVRTLRELEAHMEATKASVALAEAETS